MMKITKNYNSGKYKIFIVSLILSVCIFTNYIYSQSFTTITPILNSTGVTTFKPQSKVWTYGGYWWAVIPIEAEGTDPAGTYLWRLDGSTLTKLMKLSDQSNTFADAKAIGSITHILVVQGIADETAINSAELVSIQYKDNSPSPPTYEPWTGRPAGNVAITLDATFNEAATIDIDSNGKMWLASDAKSAINVRWSDSPYSSWSSAITLNTGHNVKGDDLCALTAFDNNKIGVLWSNQIAAEFQFRYHLDTNSDPGAWETIEIAASGSNIADDHINLAVHSNGTIYAAVKTSKTGGPQLLLLVRNPSTGNWSSNTVQNLGGTRPVALLNESENKIFVIYHPLGQGDILYKYSSLSTISFPSTASILDSRDNFQDITSTKQSFTDEVLILYNLDHSNLGGPSWWYGTNADASPFPVELSLFNAVLIEDKVALNWRTETEINNYGFEIERAIDTNDDWATIAFVNGNGNSNSPKFYDYIDYDIKNVGRYYYRLKQIDNDGSFEYSDVVSIEVGVPNSFYLNQNYPNPFNPITKIDFSLPEKQIVLLRVYNTLGELVGELVNEIKEPGIYSVAFDASELPSGTYFYTISTGKYSAAKKMSLLK